MGNFKKLPSDSSASKTAHSPFPNFALLLIEFITPPLIIVGSNFAVDNIRGKAQSVSSILGNNDAYDKLDTLTVDLPAGIKEIVEKIKDEKISDAENLLNRCLELLGYIEINDSTRKEFIAEINKKESISFSSKEETLSTEENIITLLQAIVSTIEFQFG